MTPRLMLAAASSGSGKTTIACAILQALTRMGEHPVSFKCGPDYIDPMFHRQVLGVPSRNLDPVSYTHLDVYKRQALTWSSTPPTPMPRW